MKREALEQWRERVGERGGEDAQAERSQVDQLCAVLADRERAKAIVPAEPEAGLLKLKNGRGSRPAYQASVLANEARVVVDAQVHSTSEQAALAELLDRLDGEQTRELLLDAGFNTYENLESALEREISVLCPEQAEDVRGDGEGPRRIPMREFRYVEDGDYYVCPAGERMNPWRRHGGNAVTGQRAYVQYATPACAGCERRAKCTRGEARTIQRTVGQELKEAMRLVMAQPQARRVFAQRKAMVEPVFSHLRERQGLNRFRRKGLAGVRLELRLHLIAYNISRAVAYAQRRAGHGIVALIQRFVELARAMADDANRIRPKAPCSSRWLRYSPSQRLMPTEAV
jgi:Transposase DDE domain